MTHTIEKTIGDRDLTVEFEVEAAEPRTWTSPGCRECIQVVAVWENGKPAVTTQDEDDYIIQCIKEL